MFRFLFRLSRRFVFLIAIFIFSGAAGFRPDKLFALLEQTFAPQSSDLPNPLRAEVIAIQDGDTIELKYIYSGKKAGRRIGKPLRIRFLHINCPERGRPFYNTAKQLTSKSCFRQQIQVKHKGEFDKYGRLLGEIILSDGRNLNQELVKKGLAVHFKKYSSDAEYARLENKAKKQKIGIWGQADQF